MRVKKPNRSKLMKELDKEWSAYVRTRDKTCRKCFGNSSVSAHHAFGRRHLATRWDVQNGVSLCYPCHIHWAHHDPCGFSDWFFNFVGADQYNRLSEAHRIPVKHTIEDLRSMLDWFKEHGEVAR